jgi:predicted DNA-binding protein
MKKNQTVILRLEPELRERLERMAAFEGVTISEMVRRMIKQVPVIGRIEDERVIWGNDTKRE